MTEEVKTEGVVSEPVVETSPAPEPVVPEPVVEVQTPEPAPQPSSETTAGTATAQPVEPLNPEPDSTSSPQAEVDPEPVSAPAPTPEPPPAPESVSAPESQPVIIPPPVVITQDKRSLLAKARDIIQFRKRKKLDKIMNLFLKKQSITNDEVEKLLHISDATATRYLQQLEKEEKVRRQGTPEHMSYSRM